MNAPLKIPPSVQQIIQDIRSIKIQGATNVAIATFEGLKLWSEWKIKENPEERSGAFSFKAFVDSFNYVATSLAEARPNEPLAKNGIKYIKYKLQTNDIDEQDLKTTADLVAQYSQEYLDILSKAKKKMIDVGAPIFKENNVIFTHCHSSTAENIIVEANKLKKKKEIGLNVVATETRPRYQGRITATNLLERGVDVTMIVDSAASFFIANPFWEKVDAVVIGCDEVSFRGDLLNKVGSFGITLAAYYASKPLYVATSLLKVDLSTRDRDIRIEKRSMDEVWIDRPTDLEIINPAFEIVPNNLVTGGFITESGIVEPSKIESELISKYEWVV